MPKKETVEVMVVAGEQAKIFTTKHCDPIGFYTITSPISMKTIKSVTLYFWYFLLPATNYSHSTCEENYGNTLFLVQLFTY